MKKQLPAGVLLAALFFFSFIFSFFSCFSSTAHGGEIGFLEEFAISQNRAEALKKLIPGTRDYYYYTCLFLQGEGRLAEVDQVLKQWIKRYKHTGRVREIENRQALLRYEQDPQKTMAFIADRLGLRFNHQREIPGSEKKLPVRLDPKLIARDTLTRRALDRHRGTVEGFMDSAFDWLVQTDLDPDRRRHLLGRLRRPDYPNLPKLVVDDLNYRHSRGFGSHPIHRNMLLSQLLECLRLKPDLLNNSQFINIFLTKLRPGPDANWRTDAKVRQAYLDRLWSFAATLRPAHNSLKAHILYHRLVHDRALGIYDKSRFMTYIALPRNVGYANPDYINAREHRDVKANLSSNYQGTTLLATIGNDEPLVRSFLSHFFVKASSIKPYDTYIKDTYLKPCFAEAKIVNGLGDMEQWYSMLTPSAIQALKDRIDIDFAPTNPTHFGLNEPVTLDLTIKNITTLTVKVFEINTRNYYTAHKQAVRTDIDLDGLVANHEKTYTYKVPPLRRVKRTFEFPAIQKRGVFVVECIGNGKSSRAVIRKGNLHYLARQSIAGHVFTIFNEANQKLSEPVLLLAGHHYKAGDDGTITVPYSARPGRQPIILLDGDFACLDSFNHLPEQYHLNAGFYVDREALLKHKEAKVLIRPSLLLNGTPVTLSVLEQVSLTIETRDRQDVKSTQEIKDFKLFEDRESFHAFQVPDNLVDIRFTLRATVQNLSQNKKNTLSRTKNFTLNQMDKTEKIAGIHCIHAGGEYVLEVLGKTGEPLKEKPAELTLTHRDFKHPVVTVLRSDEHGRIYLGSLQDIAAIQVRRKGISNPRTYRWPLPVDAMNYPPALHAKTGDTLKVPYLGNAGAPDRSEASLLETRSGTFVKDWFKALTLKGGFLCIDDLPAGDYSLLLKKAGRAITIRITEGRPKHGYLMSGYRQLERKNARLLHISSIRSDKKGVRIQLGHADPFTRVHVLATRYMPEYGINHELGMVQFPAPMVITLPKPESQYVTGRDMGDEFRYISERKKADIFPGNMLTRPQLLLNPWAIRSTTTGRQQAQAGGQYKGKAPGATSTRGRRASGRGEPGQPRRGGEAGFANLDFLSESSVLLDNLEPDDKDLVTLPWEALKHHHQLTVLAVSPRDTVMREVCLPGQAMTFYDLRLKNSLDSKAHFAEQKKISVAQKGGTFTLKDIRSSEFEAYDTIQKVYTLYRTLSHNATLLEFGFLMNWPGMTQAEKREKYSQYACHELNFFLYKKDPAFFKQAVLPHIKHKLHKTFLDHWFLGAPLAAFLKPWAFAQLNVVERILLAQAIAAEKPHLVRHLQDLFDLVPPNVEAFNHRFDTAIRGRALEGRDGVSFKGAKLAAGKPLTLELADKMSKVRSVTAAAEDSPALAGELRKSLKRYAGKEESDATTVDFARVARKKSVDRAGSAVFFDEDLSRRRQARRFYQKLEKTKEWAENNYYHLPIEKQNADLIRVNGFWVDYARHDGAKPFFSTRFAEAAGGFPEMMFALAVLDLPFTAAKHESQIKENAFTLTPAGPMIIFHKAINKTAGKAQGAAILASQHYYRYGERYIQDGNQKRDHFIRDEFLIGTVYGAHVVITNPTSSRQKLEVLLQVPAGAIPVLNGRYTRSVHIALEPYRTWTTDYFFYFPLPGKFPHYPVHIAEAGKMLASTAPFTLNVVAQATKIDRNSWQYISQHGTEDQVVDFLKAHNLQRVDGEKIAWRMKDRAFFKRVISLLDQRHVYHNTLWSYGIKHNAPNAAREYLKHQDRFLRYCGDAIASALITIDPVIRKTYQHMEYYPLVNARAHRLGQTRQIVNDRFYGQYMHFLKVLSYRPALTSQDMLSLTYYLLLQDRVADALAFFARINPEQIHARMQYDYCAAYLGFYTDKLDRSRALAGRYRDYPVDRWQKRFAAVTAQLDEIEGKAPVVTDDKDRDQNQAKLARTDPAMDFTVEGGAIQLTYQQVTQCRVNFYAMDIELLFSRNPFVKQYAGQFAYIRPNATVQVALDPAKTQKTIPLPDDFKNRNVMIEIMGNGAQSTRTHFANALTVNLSENYGQLSVKCKTGNVALAKVYVKVYARMKNGGIQFYKDGYTDLRGRFDYTSLSTNELDNVARFSILILSDEYGAVVKEADPPKR